MAGSQFQFLVGLLFVHFQIKGSDAYAAMHVQNIDFDCTSGQSQHDTPQPACSRSLFLHDNRTNVSEFGNIIVNTIDIINCLTDSGFISYRALGGHIVFNSNVSPDLSSFNCTNCSCTVQLSGPPDTFYELEVKQYTSSNYGNDLYLDDEYRHSCVRLPCELDTIANVMRLVVGGGMVSGQLSFNVSFQAVPDCLRQLQVSCFSNTTGVIETPGWIDGDKYRDNMNSCVTLSIPEDHVLMISIVNADLREYDYIIMYSFANCTEENIHCYYSSAYSNCRIPDVINFARTVSFGFYSDANEQGMGFRLLYSFHKSSEVPHQLPDFKWDCNVSYYNSFKQHFVCRPDFFCSDNKDKIGCHGNKLCGMNLLTLGHNCYRYIEVKSLTSWNDAADICTSYGGRLAVLNDPLKWDNVMNFTKTRDVPIPTFIGLRMAASVQLPEMYQHTWIWADDTLAVRYNISFRNVDPTYCSAITDLTPTLNMTSCKKEQKAAFLCETDFTTSSQIKHVTTISLPTPSSWNSENMATCRFNQTTHTFLACDVSTNCSAANQRESLICSSRFSPSVPFFTCMNKQRVPYTLVCNFQKDCCDGSDEDFCKFRACESRKYYTCADKKQCISRKQVCDKRSDCVDKSDEAKCQQRILPSELMSNSVQPPARIDFTGYGNFTVTRLSNFSCPETHFLCPDKGYCVPVYVRCNNVNDCPGKEDEMDCDHYTCPGFYRCRQSKICLHKQNLCDRISQCPQHDDELMCDFVCPQNCHCYGYAFICSANFTAQNYPQLRSLDAVGTGMKPEDLWHNDQLIHLNLKNCGITVIVHLSFPNLRSLDLSYNKLQELKSSQLSKLENLLFLSLAYNSFMTLNSLVHTGYRFPNVIGLDLSGIAIEEINDTFFNTFPNVQYLNMTSSGLKTLPQTGVQSLHSLRTLDLRDCPVNTFFYGVFKDLKQLETIYANNYKLCCPTVLPEGMDSENCHAPTDEVSSCHALLRLDVFRVFLGLYALLALMGNLASFVYRVCIERGAVRTGFEVFVTHLCVADFLMGVYLAIIGIADRIYYGNYLWNDTIWKHSVACAVAGVLSLVSSEVSAYFICLITLERVLVTGFPHKNWRFSRSSAHAACLVSWFIGLTLALIPLLPITSHWKFYSQSGICIPLPITRKQFDGNDYAFAIMIVVNFVLFVCIAIGQLLVYWSIQVNTVRSKDCNRKSKDAAIARRLLSVVMTDFLCWFPIGILGLMARSGVPISGEVNVAMAIFVLPFNSALNPFLYTFNILMERRRKIYQDRKTREEGQETICAGNTVKVFNVERENGKDKNYSKTEAFQLLSKFMDDGLLTPDQIRHYVWDIYEG